MRLRQALLTISLATLPAIALAAPAHAITCPMLSDATGDSHAFAGPIYSAGADIVSADIASGATTVTAELRVASLADEIPSNFAPRWDLTWKLNTTDYTVQLRRVVAFNTYVGEFYIENTSAGVVPFTVDTATSTIRWEIPRSLLPDLATPGATFTGLKGVTFVLPSVFNGASDVATTTETYVDQSTGCITSA